MEIKKHHKDALVFFRVGDFYELFYKDAEIAANELGIVLTKKSAKNLSIPMAGIPYHAYENYLARLIKSGYKVAICEQMETPLEAKQLKKEVVDRAVVRIVTPGTVTEENILVDGTHNYLAIVHLKNNKIVVAWVDISTGDFCIESSVINELHNILYRINPKEILIKEIHKNILNEELISLTTIIPAEKFNYISAHKILYNFYNMNFANKLTDQEIIASGVLLDYLTLTQKHLMMQLVCPQVWNKENVMRLDFFTRKSLELDKKLNGEYLGSLRSIIDKTHTKEGKRLLQEWLNAPLVNCDEINNRLNVVEYFINNKNLTDSISNILKNTPDIIRLFSKIMLGRGNPKDLFLLRISLDNFTLVRNVFVGQSIPLMIKQALLNAGDYSFLQTELKNSLKEYDELPITIKGGNFINCNYRTELESFQKEHNEILNDINQLQEKYALKAKIAVSSIKIQNNNLIGFFVEVSNKLSSHFFDDNQFIHKQTLINSVRFVTRELIEKESLLIKSANKIEAFEEKIYQELLGFISNHKENILNVGKAVALIDVLSSFARLALEYNFVKPIVNETNDIKIISGRHPVVEIGLKLREEKQFISNNCVIDNNSKIFLITGPNMAGKSTYLRQNAIIIILSHIGCYVPAQEATIGIVDAIFSRVGASDNLYQGQSTFMVEMMETSTILHNATNRSFIILDEIGRGTSTYDGISLAFAIIHYLHNRLQSKVLFATHYHELTKLKNTLKNLKTFFMKVENINNELIFMHNVVPGEANKSYGIYAAKLAGMPKDIILQAEQYLMYLEQSANKDKDLPLLQEIENNKVLDTELNSYESSSKELNAQYNAEIVQYLKSLNIDNLTPKNALDILYNIKDNLAK